MNNNNNNNNNHHCDDDDDDDIINKSNKIRFSITGIAAHSRLVPCDWINVSPSRQQKQQKQQQEQEQEPLHYYYFLWENTPRQATTSLRDHCDLRDDDDHDDDHNDPHCHDVVC